MKRTARYFLLLVAFAAILVAAGFLDSPASKWAHDLNRQTGFSTHYFWPLWIIRRPGNFFFTLIIAVPVAIWHVWKWRAALMLLICGAVAGIADFILKWFIGRHRPFKGYGVFELHPMQGGFHALIKTEESLSFPSGDVTLAAATAMCMSLLFPRWKWAFFAWAGLVALQRIVVQAHYPSDTVAGMGLGIVCAAIVWNSFPSLRRPGGQHPEPAEVWNKTPAAASDLETRQS